MTINDANLVFKGLSPNGGKQKQIDSIVLHHRAGNGDVLSIHIQHQKQGWWGIGYHYYIRKDGSIWKGRDEHWVGSHAGSLNDYNKHSIGICFEGNFETENMTDEQVKSGRELIADIKSRYSIKQVLGHKDIAATACPGKNFRWKEILAAEQPVQENKGKEVTVRVGTTNVTGRLIDNVTYVPLRDFVFALTTRTVVTWSAEKGAAVELV